MKNFKGEKFPDIEIIKTFDNEINKASKNISKNLTINEVLANKQEIIPKKGAYFFYDTKENKIVYVGISRNIKFRLQQHTNHKSSLSASLAYLMAKADSGAIEKDPVGWNKPKGYWSDLKEKFEDDRVFRSKYQNKIKNFKAGFIEMDNDFKMALFEIYAAIKLKSKWNSFKTH
jgi:hypothetical protein